MESIFPLFLLIPLLTAGTIALFLRQSPNLAAYLSTGSAAVNLFLAAFLLLGNGEEGVFFQHEWLRFGDFGISLGFLFNPPTALLLFVVTFVGFLIHLFSLGYMQHDRGKARFFGGLAIFMFSMLGIVFASNLAMLFVFWELVGFSSYLLIAHYHDTEEAAAASKKAFIVNRIGDLGFLIGIVWVQGLFGTTDLVALKELAALDPSAVSTGLGLALICGFLGKSAQFPLHVWLPDAMAGPTPVSALIHAATMVAAGIFYLVRIDFLLTPSVETLILWLGIAMALYAGLVALAQSDIKKILAYSTLSQLGYMAAAFGLGYPGVALFHLMTHAFFKALLFLGSGSVIHALHHEQDIFKMGGLRRSMPVTSLTFAIGIAALIGVNFTSGFFSKESILAAAAEVDPAAFFLLLFGAFLTALYMGRLFLIAFLGEAKSEAAAKAHEPSLTMRVPLLVLAVLSVIGGFHWIYPSFVQDGFYPDFHQAAHLSEGFLSHFVILIFGTLAWIGGLVLAVFFYGIGAKEDALEKRSQPLFKVLRGRLYIDEIYDRLVYRVQQRISDILDFCDTFFVGGVFVRGGAGVAGLLGILAKSAHTGSLRNYVFWFFGGVAIFTFFALQ
ncbi:MAG: NADH-quinone oxidoreductase subunit L [Puniceicoccaceae bacterium]